MKKALIITLCLCAGFTVGCNSGEEKQSENKKESSNELTIKGSDTVLPLSQSEAEAYGKKNEGARLIVTGGGSGTGITALMDGNTDIAMSSRKIKLDERMSLESAKKDFKEVIVAHDALGVIVNQANKVSQLTREQLEGIFTGQIANWKEVGGDDLKIVVYSRETSSGTYEFFKEHVMNKKNYASSVLNMPATGGIIESVSETKGAIGYVGLAYFEKDVKPLKISFDSGKSFIEPSMANAKNLTYPITRPLFYYYLTCRGPARSSQTRGNTTSPCAASRRSGCPA